MSSTSQSDGTSSRGWHRVGVGLAILVPIATLTVLVAMFAINGARSEGLPPFVDWLVHTNAVSRAVSGQPLFPSVQLDGPYRLPDVMPYGWAYPPASIVPLAPFALPLLGLPLWLALGVGAFVSGIWAALRRDLPDRTAIAFAIALLGLVVLYLPLVSGVLSANTNLAIAGLYAWCWATGRGTAKTGAIAAVAALIKIYPGVLVFWPTGQARRRSLAAAVAVAAGATLLTLPIVGLQSWADFATAMGNAELSCGASRVSIPCLVEPVVGSRTSAKLVGVAVGLVFFVLALRTRSDRLAFVLFGAAMLAPVPDGHLHYWLIAYVAIVVVFGGVVAARRKAAEDHRVPALPRA